MPKPPGNGVYRPVRGHRPRSAAGEYPRPTASLLSKIRSPNVTVSETSVKGAVTGFMTALGLGSVFRCFHTRKTPDYAFGSLRPAGCADVRSYLKPKPAILWTISDWIAFAAPMSAWPPAASPFFCLATPRP
jgi:hypothetical protein